MSGLYGVIKALQAAQGSNAKSAILEANKDNELLKDYLRATYDPALSYYIKKAPASTSYSSYTFDGHEIDFVYTLADRLVTGNAAVAKLKARLNSLDLEGQELLSLLISRSVGAGIGDTMILKVWPGLWFSVPYQRCSLLDAKAKERFSKLPKMLVQGKLDGSFLYLVKDCGKPAEAITRAGSKYPAAFAEKLARGVPDGVVLVGEALVIENGVVLDRQTGNGTLNSVLKGGPLPAHLHFSLTAWDLLIPEEFYACKSDIPYSLRLEYMADKFADYNFTNVKMIETFPVETLEEAYRIYSEHTARGEEGCVLKNPSSLWANGTSKDMVKMKISFEIDLEITHIAEGTGKAAGMMGAVGVKSSEGLLKADVGTGWSDADRKYIWDNREYVVGKILTLKANDILSNRSNDAKSLFLPVAIEVRTDKFVADSYHRCLAQLNAAKGLK